MTAIDDEQRDAPVGERPRLVTGPFVAVTVTAFVFFFYIGMVIVTVPRFIEDELGQGEFGVGLAVASFALAAVFARPFLGRLTERFGRRALMMSGALLASLASVATALASELWHVLVLRAAMGLGEAALFVAAATLIADLSPPNRRAESASYFSVAVYGGLGLGPSLGEWVLGESDDLDDPAVRRPARCSDELVDLLERERSAPDHGDDDVGRHSEGGPDEVREAAQAYRCRTGRLGRLSMHDDDHIDRWSERVAARIVAPEVEDAPSGTAQHRPEHRCG
ncbi:MAG: MFS transporter, partial [Ilumatobacteraceae bacterium]